jgi:hypothetical protein
VTTAEANEFVPFNNAEDAESGLAGVAIELIGRALDLMARSKRNGLDLVWSRNPDGLEGSVRMVRTDLDAVRNGELRAVVVAPMKAGKSTLVNAIIGYELLPARGSAMTTLPTRIVLDHVATAAELSAPEGLRPEFRLGDADARQLERLIEAIGRRLPGISEKITYEHSHLTDLVRRITAGELVRVERTVSGRAAVQAALMDLNDVLRLAELTGLSNFARLADVPVIRTPYWSPNAREHEGPGRLVIIDTPGPDEAILAAVLAPVVVRQLTESHIVFVVLDYTHMNNQADKRIRELMQSTVGVIGKDKLYGIVNRIDQRDSESGAELTDDQLVRSVGAMLGLPPELAGERVYMTSAEYALRSAMVLGEIAGGRLHDVHSSESVRRLVRRANANAKNFERELDRYARPGGIDELAEFAQVCWDENGLLDAFLDSALADLRARALPTLIMTALDKTRSEVADLADGVRARRTLIGRKSGDLAKAATDIAAEMDRVAAFRSSIAPADKLADKTLAAVGKILDEAGRKGDDVIKTMDSSLTGNNTRNFDTNSAALMFIEATTGGPRESIKLHLSSARERAEAEIGRAATEYVTAEGRKVQPIIDRAAAGLKDVFNIKFTVPDFTLTVSDADVSVAPEHHSQSWTTTETRTSYERRWYTAWLYQHEVTESYEVPHYSSYYTVDVKALAGDLRSSLQAAIAGARAQLSGQVRQSLKVRMSDYHSAVEAFLLRYKQILEQSARDNQLEEREQQDLRERLGGYLADALELQQQIEEHRAVVEEQLKAMKEQRARSAN